jgi:NitT/TauT family transport system substrate-binding protein
MIGPHMWSEGGFSQIELDRMVDALKLTGEIKADVDWSKLIDKSFLPADLQVEQ